MSLVYLIYLGYILEFTMIMLRMLIVFMLDFIWVLSNENSLRILDKFMLRMQYRRSRLF